MANAKHCSDSPSGLLPLTWGATITYIAARMAGATNITLYMEDLFPGPIYYIGMTVAVLGNLFLWVQKLMVPVRRQEQSEIKKWLLVPPSGGMSPSCARPRSVVLKCTLYSPQ